MPFRLRGQPWHMPLAELHAVRLAIKAVRQVVYTLHRALRYGAADDLLLVSLSTYSN